MTMTNIHRHDAVYASMTSIVFGAPHRRPAHHADTRQMNDDDIMSATRGLQMTKLQASDLHDLLHEHAHRDLFASAVIAVAAARRLWLTGEMDLTKVCSIVLVAIHRDPALVARMEADKEIDRRIGLVDNRLVQGGELRL